jgi:LmbE family N-acetylglucosaminyl deacetylase
MSTLAMAFPILPGKTAGWRAWMEELNGARHDEFAEARRRAGLHERTFLQHAPTGDLVIVTLEGEDPRRAFEKMVSQNDQFATWFRGRVEEFHGVDLSKPMVDVTSEMVIDSAAMVATPA